jgi:hypothetical protein
MEEEARKLRGGGAEEPSGGNGSQKPKNVAVAATRRFYRKLRVIINVKL